MDAVRPGAGTLLAKYLLGLLCLLVGLAVVLVGVFERAHLATVIGFGLAALGVLLITLKIIARNRPPH
jgi:hypothetical protein